jgi:hypothetical protein
MRLHAIHLQRQMHMPQIRALVQPIEDWLLVGLIHTVRGRTLPITICNRFWFYDILLNIKMHFCKSAAKPRMEFMTEITPKVFMHF